MNNRMQSPDTDTPLTHHADDPGFRYLGRWQLGCPAVTINSGAIFEFVFPGSACDLVFDVAGMTQFPDLLVQIDEGPVVRHRLAATSPTIRLCPANLPRTAQGHSTYWHQVRCWTIVSSTEPSQWTTQNGGCKFLGVRCGTPDTILPTLPPHGTIEFLGDSITASLRLLYDGHDGWDDRDPKTGVVHDWISGVDQQHPVLNWPWRAARILGLAPIVTGFGGQGLTNPGTNGVPPAGKAFPYVFDGTPWKPSSEPKVVVVYHGTNDGNLTPELYRDFLRLIRNAYPHADLFAVCPHTRKNFASIIRAAVTAGGDRVWFLDYSEGVITPADTVDGCCHLNPSGALRLAVRLAGDITRTLTPGCSSRTMQ
ncbi:MAG: hypothetical protein PHR35_19485 [Kiritimatiellae bacterium]|nr:hypothetical protein [Kiritimatiellia bacterium]